MSVRITRVKASEIEPPDIPLREMDDETFKSLVRSITELGYVEPIQVVEKCGGGYKIVNGYHRYQVLTEIYKESEIDVVVLGRMCCEQGEQNCWSDFDYYVEAIRLNNIHGEWNRQILGDVLRYLLTEAEKRSINKADLLKKLGSKGIIREIARRERRKAERDAKKTITGVCREIAQFATEDSNQGYIVFTYAGKLVFVYPTVSKSEFYTITSLIEELQKRGKALIDVLRGAVGK